jgi:hypothetical protein
MRRKLSSIIRVNSMKIKPIKAQSETEYATALRAEENVEEIELDTKPTCGICENAGGYCSCYEDGDDENEDKETDEANEEAIYQEEYS